MLPSQALRCLPLRRLPLNCAVDMLEDGLRKRVVVGYMTVPCELAPLHNPEQWFLSECKGDDHLPHIVIGVVLSV